MSEKQLENQAYVRALWARLLEAATARNWTDADKIFNETRIYAKSQDMAFLDLHVLYARLLIEQSEYERCYPHLRFLRDIYIQVGVTDYSFLGLRGVPPFETYLGIARDYLSSRPENMAQSELLEELIGAVDAEGQSATRATLASLRPAAPAV